MNHKNKNIPKKSKRVLKKKKKKNGKKEEKGERAAVVSLSSKLTDSEAVFKVGLQSKVFCIRDQHQVLTVVYKEVKILSITSRYTNSSVQYSC